MLKKYYLRDFSSHEYVPDINLFADVDKFSLHDSLGEETTAATSSNDTISYQHISENVWDASSKKKHSFAFFSMFYVESFSLYAIIYISYSLFLEDFAVLIFLHCF